MGLPGVWAYNQDIGSDVEDVKSAIKVIETNKFDKADLVKLVKATTNIVISLIEKDED